MDATPGVMLFHCKLERGWMDTPEGAGTGTPERSPRIGVDGATVAACTPIIGRLGFGDGADKVGALLLTLEVNPGMVVVVVAAAITIKGGCCRSTTSRGGEEGVGAERGISVDEKNKFSLS